MPLRSTAGEPASTLRQDHRLSNLPDSLCTNRGWCPSASLPPAPSAPGTHPRRARNWQPLQTPSEKVSLRPRKASNCSRSPGLNLTTAAHPLPESSTSAYEKPPTKTSPLKSARSAFPASRSETVRSHASRPAAWKAAHISRSPLLPSWRSTATLCRPPTGGSTRTPWVRWKGMEYVGPVRCFRPSRSWSTQAGVLWRRSSAKLVASHASRSSGIEAGPTTAAPHERKVTTGEASVRPSTLTTRAPSALVRRPRTAAKFSSATSSTMPASSEKSAAMPADTPSWASSIPPPAPPTSTSRPQFPLKAISSKVTTSPPSLRSCPASTSRSASSDCTHSNEAAKTSSPCGVRSGDSFPIWPYTCARADPPRRLFESRSRSSSKSVEWPGRFRSGVTVRVKSGQVTYEVRVRVPGALTVSSPTPAAMESESFPPSTPTPRERSASRRATQASHMRAPSWGSLAAHIQLPLHLTSSRLVTLAQTRLVSISAAHMRLMAAGFTRPLMGHSPTDEANPWRVKWEWASTATLESGSWRGPTHCCWAIRPVTERSTLWTSQRLEATDTKRRTRSKAEAQVSPSGTTRALNTLEVSFRSL
mmetsp:Transcript_35430/g.79943  ORF Transcript_35430/g.79943 Transcript_35430/m.79943 type:complete len:590 (-) Transcript_35430:560-2329(-)